jgi:hypothetical protein
MQSDRWPLPPRATRPRPRREDFAYAYGALCFAAAELAMRKAWPEPGGSTAHHRTKARPYGILGTIPPGSVPPSFAGDCRERFDDEHDPN